jgi:hypothetical protein
MTSDRYEPATCCTSGAWSAAKAATPYNNAVVASARFARSGVHGAYGVRHVDELAGFGSA